MDLEKQTEYGSTTPEAPEAAVKSASFKLRPVAKLALVVVALCAGSSRARKTIPSTARTLKSSLVSPPGGGPLTASPRGAPRVSPPRRRREASPGLRFTGILFGAMMAPAGKLTSLEFSEGAVLVDREADAAVSLLCKFRWLGLSACPQIGGLPN